MRSSYRELLKLNYRIALSNEEKKNLGKTILRFFLIAFYSYKMKLLKTVYNKSQIVCFVSLNGRIS